jgi:hypothetical protein
MPTWDYLDKRRLTAKDVAEAIRFRKDKGGFAKAYRQVQHWTTNHLLQTTTPLETGKGVAREYVDVPTVFIAAVLQELALFGLTVESLKPIADQLYEDYDSGDPEWVHFAAETGEFDAFLRIDLTVDAKGKLSVAEVCMYSEHPDQDPFAIPPPKTSGSIVLNVVKITERIAWPGAEDGSR